MGLAYSESGDYENAVEQFLGALEFKEGAEVHKQLAIAYSALENWDDASKHINKALGLNSNSSEYYRIAGEIAFEKKDYENALALYNHSLELNPKDSKSFYYYVHSLQGISRYKFIFFQFCTPDYSMMGLVLCKWDEWGDNLDQRIEDFLLEEIKDGSSQIPILQAIYFLRPQIFLQVATQAWTPGVSEGIVPFQLDKQKLIQSAATKIRIGNSFRKKTKVVDLCLLLLGYLSKHFGDHPIGHNIQGIFGLHDKNHFEIYVYSLGYNDKSTYRKTIQEGASHFLDVHHMDSKEIAEQIEKDGIHILIYTDG